MARIPKKASKVLRLAVADAKKAQRSKRFRLNMGVYGSMDGNVCEVCLAGAVLAFERPKRFAASFNGRGNLSLMGFTGDDFALATAIDYARIGQLMTLIQRHMDAVGRSITSAQRSAVYDASDSIRQGLRVGPAGYRAEWRHYLKAADILEGAGL